MELAVNVAVGVVAVVTLLFALYQHRLDEQRITAATAAQQQVEKELAAIRSRGDGPYLSPSNQLCGHIFEHTGNGIACWSTTAANVLWSQRDKVSDLAAGTPVILLLENSGRDARRITIETALRNCSINQEPILDSSHGLIFLKYDYEPEQHGNTVQLKVSFEASTGFQDTHIYETIHGERAFARVTP